MMRATAKKRQTSIFIEPLEEEKSVEQCELLLEDIELVLQDNNFEAAERIFHELMNTVVGIRKIEDRLRLGYQLDILRT